MSTEFIFEQLFDETSSTLTYIVGDAVTREALILDPVDHQLERDLGVLAAHGLTLVLALETHAHADHITAAGELRRRTGAKAAAPFNCGIDPADLHVEDGTAIRVGSETLTAIETPGHTAGSVCYRWRDAVFTGDTLFIGGCGRADFQGGDAGALYDSIVGRLFTLPDATRVFPGHDYRSHRVSTIGAEKRTNPRLAGKSRDEFIALMAALNLPKPKLIDIAVPANRNLGLPHGG
ncbi:MAG: MBL fold metallo-hydrolase [Betaproteobacteria bacterium]|nr:MBL fold metallo-hydrolase [Betaproteobacteria bacterium]